MSPRQGLYFVTSTGKSITSDVLNAWYRDEHVPDILVTSGFTSAFRFRDATSETIFASPSATPAKEEFLSLYPLKDLAFLETDEFKSIPVKSKLFGEGEKAVYEVVDFGVRHYSWLDGYEGERAQSHPAPGKLVITAGMTPPKSQEDDFNLWYEKEHYRMLSGCKNYIRTRRYKRDKTVSPPNFEVPTFLTIHEFDCEPGELDVAGLGKAGATEWSQRMIKSLEANEVKAWRSIAQWGELKARF